MGGLFVESCYGCNYSCTYCYAHDISIRFNRHFEPTFHADRLDEPKNTDNESQRIPVTLAFSLAAWANSSGRGCRSSGSTPSCFSERKPAMQFLFLTKNPSRLPEIDFPGNAWVGTTIDTQKRVAVAEKAFQKVNAPVKFISCEPMLERITFNKLDLFNWVIVGGCSKNTKQRGSQPDPEWLNTLSVSREKRSAMFTLTELLAIPEGLPLLKEYPQWR